MIKPIQVIAIIFAIFLLVKVILRLKNKKLTLNEFLFWSTMWVLLILLSIFPQVSDRIANFFGFGRGLDFFIVSSILLMFYLIFRVISKLEDMDAKITKLARNMALKEMEGHRKAEIKKSKNSKKPRGLK